MFTLLWIGIIVSIVGGTVWSMLFGSGARELKANQPSELIRKAKELTDIGDIDGALRCFERALSFDYHNPDAHYTVGLFCATYGKIDRAKEYLQHLRAIGSPHAVQLESDIEEFLRSANTHESSANLKVYYDTLDIEAKSSKEEIKQAYRDMVKVWHPDRFLHDPKLKAKAEHKMKELNQAYEVLSNL